ncbi:MAG: hypothetical protein V7K47_06975 [Nostoc sp.]
MSKEKIRACCNCTYWTGGDGKQKLLCAVAPIPQPISLAVLEFKDGRIAYTENLCKEFLIKGTT